MATQHFCNCYNGKGDSLERGNYRGMKLTAQIFIYFHLGAVLGEIFSIKEKFALCICRSVGLVFDECLCKMLYGRL